MRITTRQLRQIIKEEIGRSMLKEADALPTERRRVGQIMSDMLHAPDAYVINERGIHALNPKYAAELLQALDDSPILRGIIKMQLKMSYAGSNALDSLAGILDTVDQFFEDVGHGPTWIAMDKERRQAWARFMLGLSGHGGSAPGVKDWSADAEAALRESRHVMRRTAARKRRIAEMHDPEGRSLVNRYRQAAADVENSYSPDYDELAYKIDRLDQELLVASMGGMTSLNGLQSRHAREIFIRIADALGYPQVDLDQDVLAPSNLVNAVIETIKSSLPSEEDF